MKLIGYNLFDSEQSAEVRSFFSLENELSYPEAPPSIDSYNLETVLNKLLEWQEKAPLPKFHTEYNYKGVMKLAGIEVDLMMRTTSGGNHIIIFLEKEGNDTDLEFYGYKSMGLGYKGSRGFLSQYCGEGNKIPEFVLEDSSFISLYESSCPTFLNMKWHETLYTLLLRWREEGLEKLNQESLEFLKKEVIRLAEYRIGREDAIEYQYDYALDSLIQKYQWLNNIYKSAIPA